jgi:signal transduction histidine kinase
MTQQLSDLDRMKADFMSIATHELKTPINVVGGYAELIQDGVYGEVNEAQQDALTSIQEQARILTQLVNQLLDISRLEAGGLKLEIERSGGCRPVRARAPHVRGARAQAGHRAARRAGPDAPETIPADATGCATRCSATCSATR